MHLNELKDKEIINPTKDAINNKEKTGLQYCYQVFNNFNTIMSIFYNIKPEYEI